MKWLVVFTVSILAGFCNAKALVRSEIDSIKSNEIPHSDHHTNIEPILSNESHYATKQIFTPSVQNFLSSPVVQSILSNLTIQNVLSDSSIQGVLMNPAVQSVLSNPVVQSLLTNPQLQGLAMQALFSVLPSATTPMTPTAILTRPKRPPTRIGANSTPSQRTIVQLVLNGLDEIMKLIKAQINRRFPNRRG